jgi:hypothetical protein
MSRKHALCRIRAAQAAGDALGFPDPTLRATRSGLPEGIAGLVWCTATAGAQLIPGNSRRAAQDMPPAHDCL